MTESVYVFDLDDTLYLERDYIRSGFARVGEFAASRYGILAVGDYAWTLFEQGVRRNTFDIIAREFSLPDEAIGLFVSQYREHAPEIELLADARSFLGSLPSDVIGTGIITDGNSLSQWQKIRALGLADLVDNIVVTADHGVSCAKPSEYAFRLIESRFERPGVEFVYFGDNPAKDFQAPHDLGWRTVRVRREQGLHYLAEQTHDAGLSIPQFPSTSWSGDLSLLCDHRNCLQ